MEIRINDKKLDAKPDNEKTVGDVLASLEQWLENSGHRLSGISIDGQNINVSMIEEIFSREIDTIEYLDLYTNVVAELAATSLINLLEDIKEYESLNFEEKTNFFDKWKESASAAFISSEMADLFSLCSNTFSGGDISSSDLFSITEERLREVKNPSEEFAKIEPLVNEICERLVNFPLDIQTGKDRIASQTIQVFSGVTEKIFRTFKQLDSQGLLEQTDNKKPLTQQFTSFGKLLREFLEAYEKNDFVLVGDIAEYETSPKLKEFYSSIQKAIKIQGKK